jgi:Glycosyl transferases group 1
LRFLLPYNTKLSTAASSFYSDFHLGIAEAARELGHETLRFDIADGAQASATERDALYRSLATNPCDTVIDLCCWGLGLSRITVWDGSSGGEPLFDSLDMDYVGLLLDQPWFQPLPGVRSARLYVAVPDRNNLADIPLIYPELQLRGMTFAPPAVRAANDRSQSSDKRDLDVLFIGNLQRAALAARESWPNDCADLCEASVAKALAAPAESLYRIVLSAATQLGLPIHGSVGTPTALTALRAVEHYLRARMRLDAVRAAAASGATVHVVGVGWDSIELPGNVVCHSPTADYEGLFAMAGRARICLDVSSYPGGANDRVFSYSLNRAVCLSNAAGYLADAYRESGGVQFYSPAEPADLAGKIAGLLASPQRLREQAEAGRQVTLETQNWRIRLETILGCRKP